MPDSIHIPLDRRGTCNVVYMADSIRTVTPESM